MSLTKSKNHSSSQSENAAEQGYNGWDNYETWCVNLWLSSNDQETVNIIHELVAEADTPYSAGQAIREYVEDLNPVGDQASMFTDLLNGALSVVNWGEVAQAFTEEA